MKLKFYVPIILAMLIAAPAVTIGQEHNQKKIERLKRQIEKKSHKLHELTGEPKLAMGYAISPINDEALARIREDAREQASKAREMAAEARAQAEEYRAKTRDEFARQREVYSGQRFAIEKEMKDLGKLKELEGGIHMVAPGNWSGKLDGFSFNANNLSINKDLKEETSSADFNFEPGKESEGISLRVDGVIETGKVKIVIKQPNGEAYNEYTLSPLANVNWKQTITFEGMEEAAWQGKWIVTVSAENASGKYSVYLGEK